MTVFKSFGKVTIALAWLLSPAIVFAAPGNELDVGAATQAYLNGLTGAARAQSDSYFEGGYWLLLWGAMISILVDYLILRFGWSARFRTWVERLVQLPFLRAMLWSLPYAVASFILLLPWSIYVGFIREKHYDLLSQGFAGWFGEQLISLALGSTFGALLVALVMMAVRYSPKRWWIGGTFGFAIFIAIGMMIAPVFISPMFNKYDELKAGPVRDRIVEMAKSENIPADHIYVFDQSKQHKRISANVSGLGPTIRISLNDNLLNRTTLPEQVAVMGHEMGHYVLGHSWKIAIGFALVFGFCFWAASRLVPGIVARNGEKWGIRGIDDIAAWPVYSIIITALMLVTTPVRNSIIRHFEHEADIFGLNIAKEPDGFAQVAMKLSEYRKISPGSFEEALFFDHPSGKTRVRMAMEWKAKHLGEHVKTP
jgi:STE24 endopeptidase